LEFAEFLSRAPNGIEGLTQLISSGNNAVQFTAGGSSAATDVY
jgi:hypothetical protein